MECCAWLFGRSRLKIQAVALGAALIMRANGPGRFCQVFLRVIHNFSPAVPFRAGNRAPPHTSRKKWSIRTGHRRHRKTSFGPLEPGRSGALKRLVCLCLCLCRLGLSRRCPAVFSGALLAVFKSVWRQSSNQKYFWGFFRSFTSNSASDKIIASLS